MDVKILKLSGYVFMCHTCNFLNLILPWKQFVIRRPLNGKRIIFLKGHRVTHNPPTVPINKMASFSAEFGALGSKGGLPLNFKGTSSLEGAVTLYGYSLKCESTPSSMMQRTQAAVCFVKSERVV